MKNLYALILSLSFLVIMSCNRPERVASPDSPETPKALQAENLLDEVSSYSKRGDGDLIDELYSEQVNKQTELKEIEILEDKNKEDEVESVNEFEKFESKSSRFYNSAKNHVNSVSDSVLKATLLALISESERKYNNRSAKLTALVAQIKTNNITISDYQDAIKVIVTIPIIEKYQAENLPNDSLYRRIISEQQKIILKMKKVVTRAKPGN